MPPLTPALRAFLVDVLADTSVRPPKRAAALEVALTAAGAKPAWMWEFIDPMPRPEPCPAPQPVLDGLTRPLEAAGWTVRHDHISTPRVGLGCLGFLFRGSARELLGIHTDAVFASPDRAAADELAAAWWVARTKRSLAGELRLGQALGYPAGATRGAWNREPPLHSLGSEPDGSDALWICGFLDTEAGRAQARQYLTRWAAAMAATFPEIWPLAPLVARDEADPHSPAALPEESEAPAGHPD